MRSSFVRTLPAILLAAAAGCYHYVPEPARPLPRAAPVRVHLSKPTSFELPALTAHNVGSMDAEVVRDDDGTLVVSARWLDAVTGHGYPGEGWTFELPRSDVARVDVRRLSVWRTALVFAGGLAATYLGFDALAGSDAGGGTGGTGGNPR